MSSTITSANSVFTLVVPLVFPVPINVQGYAADDAFATEAVDSAEAVMGVDGKMSAGYTPFPTKLNVTLQADSDSISIFDTWLGAMQTAKEVFFGDATIVMPSVGRTYILTKGAMTRITQFPAAKKILQPVQYEITFESVVAVPLAA
jgi:hypothetical protein